MGQTSLEKFLIHRKKGGIQLNLMAKFKLLTKMSIGSRAFFTGPGDGSLEMSNVDIRRPILINLALQQQVLLFYRPVTPLIQDADNCSKAAPITEYGTS